MRRRSNRQFTTTPRSRAFIVLIVLPRTFLADCRALIIDWEE
jgi:hypothetical protein